MNLLYTLKIALLALVQGAAELLPVSSSAHVIVAEHLMGFDPSSPEMTFLLVMLHTGTMFAVLLYFWPRWRQYVRPTGAAGDGTAPVSGMHFLKMVVLATACTGVLGLALKLFIERVVLVRLLGHDKGEVEQLFKSLPLVGAALFAVGVFILIAGTRSARVASDALTPRTSVLVGLVQGLCLPFRGFSRSGATISTALLRGVARPLAEDFSFALAVLLTPPVIVYELYRLMKASDWQGAGELVGLLGPGVLGMALSLLSGLVALRFLSAVLERGGWKYFGYYCLVAGVVIVAVAA